MKYYVTINGVKFTVELEGNEALVVGPDGEHRVQMEPLGGLVRPITEVVASSSKARGRAPSSGVTVSMWGDSKPTTTPAKVLRLLAGGQPIEVTVENERDRLRRRLTHASRLQGKIKMTSPLPGVIRQILLFPGNSITAGQPILTLEAMKMENEVRAEVDGRLTEILVQEGQIVNTGDELLEIDVKPSE